MMTIHAAKGLEFNNVFVVGLEEDLFPSAMAKDEFRGLEEERRLFYVAITRAKEFCMITYAKSRFRNGQINACNPSRFLRDIDTDYLNVNAGVLGSGGFGVLNRPETYTKELFDYSSNTRTTHPERSVQRESTPLSQPKNESFGQPKFVNARTATPKVSAGSNAGEVGVGAIIKHERFGIGKVTAVTGDVDSRKATVEFENSGVKQLLLKFARIEIIG